MNKLCICLAALSFAATAEPLEVIEVEGQPLAANAQRLMQALDFLGAPLANDVRAKLQSAITQRDAAGVQAALDPFVLCVVDINPESRVKAQRGPAAAKVQQAGYTPVLMKVINHATSVAKLRIRSTQAGPSYAGVAKSTMERERQTHLRENENTKGEDRFLKVSMFESPPMTANLSGLEVEYAIALIYSSESGKREVTLAFDIGQGTQDLGFRAEVPVLLEVRPAVTVKLDVKDFDGKPTTARLTFTDAQGHVFPPQARRLAPDFFFQKHLYRANGSTVLLPPGEFTMEASRGPEYRTVKTKVVIPAAKETTLPVKLERWINAADFGYYSGDHHIHGAGCAHYTSPTEGMLPEQMFQQVKGEGLNVGCVLSWGYGFEYQRAAHADEIRHGGQRLRFRRARPCVPAEPARARLSRRGRHQGLADLDHARPPLGEAAGRFHRLSALRQRHAGECGHGGEANARIARHKQGCAAHAERNEGRAAAGAV